MFNAIFLSIGILSTSWLVAIVVYIMYNKTKPKKPTPRLCGLHAARYLKVGEMGILDSENCVVCKQQSFGGIC